MGGDARDELRKMVTFKSLWMASSAYLHLKPHKTLMQYSLANALDGFWLVPSAYSLLIVVTSPNHLSARLTHFAVGFVASCLTGLLFFRWSILSCKGDPRAQSVHLYRTIVLGLAYMWYFMCSGLSTGF